MKILSGVLEHYWLLLYEIGKKQATDFVQPTRWNRVKQVLLLLITLLGLSNITLAQWDGKSTDTITGTYTFNIPSSTVRKALNEFARQTELQLVFSSELVDQLPSNQVKGRYTVAEALEIVLKGTFLSGSVTERGVIVIQAPDAYQKTIEGNREMGTKKNVLAATIAFFVGNSAQGVLGEELENEGKGFVLEEIVVTAQKREQGINDVPMSVTAISGKDIDRKGFVSMADYLTFQPNVNIIDRGAGRNAIIIRGVTTNPQNEGATSGSTVGVYLNEIPLTGYTSRGGSADIKLIDVERVEVLRGPQGTLYGDSALGGAVKHIANKPNLSEIGGSVKVGLSNTSGHGGDNYNYQGVINVPLIEDVLAVRAVGYHFVNSGYIINRAQSDSDFFEAVDSFGAGGLARDASDVGNDEYIGGRISLLWNPLENMQIEAMYLTQDVEQEGFPEVQLTQADDFAQTRIQIDGTYPGIGKEGLEDDIDIYNFNISYQLDNYWLYSSSSYIEGASVEQRDIGAFLGGAPFPQRISNDVEVFVQEVRITSDYDGPAQFIVGGYYQDISSDKPNLTVYVGDPAFNPLGDDPVLANRDRFSDRSQLSIFGEVSYELSDQLKLTLGARKSDYERKDLEINLKPEVATRSSSKLEESPTTLKANLSYEASDDTLLYAQWAEGFRFGRPLAPLDAALCDTAGDGKIDGTGLPVDREGVESDSIESYELGAKLGFAGGAIQVNTALFRNEWEDIPINLIVSCGETVVVNAGKARTKGIEFETLWLANENLVTSFNFAYLDAELKTDIAEIGGQTGDRLPGSPKVTAGFGVEYSLELMGRDSFFRADYNYVGGYYNNLQEDGVEAGDYQQLNLKAGVELDAVDLELFINNVLDENSLTWVGSVFTSADQRAFRLRPRTIGMNFRYSF